MKKKSNNNAVGIGKIRKFLILAFSIIVAAALVVTGILCFNPSKKSPTDEAESGDVSASASTTHTASNLGGRVVDLSTKTQDGTVKKGDVVTFPFLAAGAASGPNLATSNNGFWPWANGEYTITLPIGTYKIELWGAQGGGANGSTSGRAYGGYGGYASATLTLTTATTFYLNVGGQGEGTAYRCVGSGYSTSGGGGYNGGGNVLAGGGSIASASTGGAGGGATHFATMPGLLSDAGIKTSPQAVLMVAGGGGGSSHDTLDITHYKGCGGGITGQEAANQGTYVGNVHGMGGTQTAGGALSTGSNVSNSSTDNVNSHATAGSFGQGGNGGSWGNGGGGGGGGWFGGSGGFIQGGAGGSGYIRSNTATITVNTGNGDKTIAPDTRITNGVLIAGGSTNQNPVSNATLHTAYSSAIPNPTGSGTVKGQTGNGFARITMVSINQVPVQQTFTKNNVELGTGSAFSVKSYNLATDPDGTNTSGMTTNSTYFYQDNSNKELSKVANSKLYVDSTCNKPADNYIDYNFSADGQTLNINKFNKLPRTDAESGLSGLSNNSLKLYVRIRDNFTNNVANCGYGVYSFTLNYKPPTVGHGSGTVGVSADNKIEYTYGNNAATGAFEINLKKALHVEGENQIKIDAAGLLTNYDPEFYQVLILPDNPAGKPYEYQYPSGSQETFYSYTSSNNSYTARTGYKSVIVKWKSKNNDNHTISWTLYLIEKSSFTKANREPVGITYTGGQTIKINFKIDNTRPILNNAISADNTVIELGVGDTKNIDFTKLIIDADETGKTVTATSHVIKEVLVPTTEFVQLDKYGGIVSVDGAAGASAGKSYYNVADSSIGFPNVMNDATTNIPTGFSDKIASQTADPEAFVMYGFDKMTLTLTGLRSSYSQYSTTREGKSAYTGGVTSNIPGLTAASTVANPGHFYLLVRIEDTNDPSDGGIWRPVAITVGADASVIKPVSTGTETHTSSGQSKMSAMPTAEGGKGDEFYFSPMGLNIGTASYAVGRYKKDDGTLSDPTKQGETVQPLAIDANNFAVADGTGISSWNNSFNEFLMMSETVGSTALSEYIYNSIGVQGNKYIEAELVPLYIEQSKFVGTSIDGISNLGRVRVGASAGRDTTTGVNTITMFGTENIGGIDYYKFYGLKIKLKSTTMDRYIYATTIVKDSSGTSANTVSVNIAIKCSNTSVGSVDAKTGASAADNHVAGFWTSKGAYSSFDNGSDVYNYTYSDGWNASASASSGALTLTYRMPMQSYLFITPYDIISDYDMFTELDNAKLMPKGGFTLNGLTGTFSNGTFDTSGTGTVKNPLFLNSAYGVSGYYGSADYKTAISDLLTEAAKTSAVSAVSTSNLFGAPSDAFETDPVYNDRLFFERTDYNSRSDSFTFDPYDSGNAAKDFAIGGVQADASGNKQNNYIAWKFGNKLMINGKTHDLDFVMINSRNRTSIPIDIALTVRDRAGSSVNINIKIEIVNTAPVVNNASAYEIAVKPVADAEDGSKIVTPTSVSFRPVTTSYDDPETNRKESIMYDADGDSMLFLSSRGVLVANTPKLDPDITSFDDVIRDHPEYLTDDGTPSGRLLTEYVTATLANGQITVSALNSTKNIGLTGDPDRGVYVYFFVTDGNQNGEALGYKQIEVINTSPEANNSSVNGFDKDDPTWAIASSSAGDIIRSRYITGSETAVENLKDANYKINAVDADIKLIATDPDALQGKNGVMLSQLNGSGDFINLGSGSPNYDRAVPSVRYNNVNTGSFAVYASVTDMNGNPTSYGVIESGVGAGGNATPGFIPDEPDNKYSVELLFFIADKGEWYARNDLVANLPTDTVLQNACFDSEGRWILTDWAIRLKATKPLGEGKKLALKITMRDEAALGGNTAGLSTAFASDRTKAKISVENGTLELTVYQTIAETGIVTKDEYAKYNGYYAVEDPAVSGDAYVINNGTVKSAAKFDASATYADAYRYTDIIEIPASKSAGSTSGSYETVYVPMSFFGMPVTLATPISGGTGVSYSNSYVGYDLHTTDPDGTSKNGKFAKNDIDTFASAITLSDGNRSWTGTTGADGTTLADNPYIDIKGFTDTNASNAKDSSLPYYNFNLAVPAYDGNGNPLGFNDSANEIDIDTNKSMLYLAAQKSSLTEHNYGLAFTKKYMRTGAANLTLTIKLAKCKVNTDLSDANDTDNDVVSSESGLAQSKDYRTVTVFIHIANSQFDLTGDVTTLPKDGELAYDTNKKTYYMNISLPSSDSTSIALKRTSADKLDGKLSVYYTDGDISDAEKYKDSETIKYRDYAYFLNDALGAISSWSATDSFVRKLDDPDAPNTLMNVADSEKAENSVLNYYGVSSLVDLKNVAAAYNANGGAHGYNGYFGVSMSEGGRVLNIAANRKTFINDVAYGNICAELGLTEPKLGTVGINGYTQAELDAARPIIEKIYESRGLKATFAAGSTTVSSAYYTLKVLVYDDCGAGVSEASFTAMELRITIKNATPTIKYTDKSGNHVYTISRAAGETSAPINLYDFVSDPDIYVVPGASRELATEAQFMLTGDKTSSYYDQLAFETKDYLKSPFAYSTPIGSSDTTKINPSNSELIKGKAGLSYMNSTVCDVIMTMMTDPGQITNNQVSASTQPTNNSLYFKVNKRTTHMVDGVAQDVSEFSFTLRFCDSNDAYTTESMTFIVKVLNKAPVKSTPVSNIRMRSGHHFTLLTTYYDKFIGGESSGSYAYNNSLTKNKYWDERGEKSQWKYNGSSLEYSDLTSTSNVVTSLGTNKLNTLDSTAEYEKTDYDLGYIGIADDDKAWQMRIVNYRVPESYGDPFSFGELNKLSVEGSDSSMYDKTFPTALTVTAKKACNDVPVEITIIDGEGGIYVFTLRVTVISSPPIARDPSDSSDRAVLAKAGLEGVPLGNGYVKSSFRLFTIPSGDKEITVSDGIGVKQAKKTFTIKATDVATDRDSGEDSSLALFNGGLFSVNNTTLRLSSDGIYHAPYFDIKVDTNGGNKSFTLTATGFNPESAYETLQFYIEDPGNRVIGNALLVTIQVYTEYSDMTNPTVAGLNGGDYNLYLDGSNTFNVRSYDEYMGYGEFSGGNTVGEPSVYNYLVGSAENKKYAVEDPDVVSIGSRQYPVTLYALMGQNGEQLSRETLAAMFVRDSETGEFHLKDRGDASQYIIGGINKDGANVTAESTSRLAVVNKYASFSFLRDGSGISFVPATATLDKKLLLYVEVYKRIDSRTATREDGVLYGGSLFRLVVDNSAPRAIGDEGDGAYNLAFTGSRGDSITFDVFGRTGEYGALFTDSDADDTVTLAESFDPNDTKQTDYVSAMSMAMDLKPDLDWAETSDKPRAFTVAYDKTEGTVTITIDRRIDERDEDGNYSNAVSFPLVLTGIDSNKPQGGTCKTVIMVTIVNDPLSAEDEYSSYDPKTNVGYQFSRDNVNDRYVLDAQIMYSNDLTISLNDILVDNDIIKNTDADSFMFVEGEVDFEYVKPVFMIDAPVKAYYYTDEQTGIKEEIALVTPLGGDKWHKSGIRLHALSQRRGATATVYVRVLDRSGNAELPEEGVIIQINITVMNDRPYVLPGMDLTSVTLVGSRTKTNKTKVYCIDEFVDDNNSSDVVGPDSANYPETYLRIESQAYRVVDEIYSTDKDTTVGKFPDDTMQGSVHMIMSNDLFTLVILEDTTENKYYSQNFYIETHPGYFGRGAIELTVADGNRNTRTDTMNVSFRIEVEVTYDPDEVETLKEVTTYRGKSTVVSIESLIPDIENTITESQASAQSNAMTAAAKNAPAFNPSSSYRLIDVSIPDSSKDYVSITHHEEGTSVWTIRALKVTAEPKPVMVKYALKSDPSVTKESYFLLTTRENQKPTLIYSEMKFIKYLDDGSGDGNAFMLNTAKTITLRPADILQDPENDNMTFISVKSQKPSLVKASLVNNNELLSITFNARGTANITITVADETDEVISRTFRVINQDLPEPSLWTRLVSSLESNPVMWAIIIGCVVLALFILIIILAILRKRRREREELEALLVSEMEIEEQMYKLAGGPAPTGYQSFGYLQSAPGQVVDPSMLLGGGPSNRVIPSDLALPAPDANRAPDMQNGGNNYADPNAGMGGYGGQGYGAPNGNNGGYADPNAGMGGYGGQGYGAPNGNNGGYADPNAGMGGYGGQGYGAPNGNNGGYADPNAGMGGYGGPNGNNGFDPNDPNGGMGL